MDKTALGPKFKFGDYVYHATAERTTTPVPCWDCGGKRYNTIILDGETFTVDCEGCKRGWMGSTGDRDHYIWTPLVHEGTIAAIEKDWNEDLFEYRMDSDNGGRWILKEEDTFSTKEEAEGRAEEIKDERVAEETRKIVTKLKPDKSWVWHVRYFQKQIKDAQNTIEHATLQLNAAKKHAKETP